MSTTSSTEDESVAVYRKPQVNVYTVMLVISLLAILVGILFLWLHLDDYQWKTKGGPSAALPQATSGAFAGVSPRQDSHQDSVPLLACKQCLSNRLRLTLLASRAPTEGWSRHTVLVCALVGRRAG